MSKSRIGNHRAFCVWVADRFRARQMTLIVIKANVAVTVETVLASAAVITIANGVVSAELRVVRARREALDAIAGPALTTWFALKRAVQIDTHGTFVAR